MSEYEFQTHISVSAQNATFCNVNQFKLLKYYRQYMLGKLYLYTTKLKVHSFIKYFGQVPSSVGRNILLKSELLILCCSLPFGRNQEQFIFIHISNV